LLQKSQGEIARRKVTWALESPQFADIVHRHGVEPYLGAL
jgi:hypothetical protein